MQDVNSSAGSANGVCDIFVIDGFVTLQTLGGFKTASTSYLTDLWVGNGAVA